MIKIIKQPADHYLNDYIDHFSIGQRRTYMIHLSWSKACQPAPAEIIAFDNPNFLRHLQKAAAPFTGQIYLLHDHDIIAVIEAISVKIIKAFYTQILAALGIDEGMLRLDMIDMGTHFEKAETVARQKFKAFQQTTRHTKIKADQEVGTEGLIKFDHSLLETIAERRERQKKSVLLVEDDAFSRHLVKNVLGKDYKVIEAENTIQALNAYVLNAPDIVFLDINLPDDTGLNIIRKIKSYDPNAFIVMLSGNAYKNNITQALGQGAKGFIGKPFNKKRILEALRLSPHLRSKDMALDGSA